MLGFAVREAIGSRAPYDKFLRSVHRTLAGLAAGDFIVEINGRGFSDADTVVVCEGTADIRFFLASAAGRRCIADSATLRHPLLQTGVNLEERFSQETELTIKLAVALVAALLLVTGSASAGVLYKTSGEDLYRIQSAATSSRVTYSGAEELSVAPEGKRVALRSARSLYSRRPRRKGRATARFVQVLQPDGTFEDRIDDDPDFSRSSNQPFAVRLDKPTLRDLRDVARSGAVLGDVAAGGAAVLRGYLRPATGGPIGGRPKRGGTLRSRRRDDRAHCPASRNAGLGNDADGRNRVLRARRRDAASLERQRSRWTRGSRRDARRSPSRCESFTSARFARRRALKRPHQFHLQGVAER